MRLFVRVRNVVCYLEIFGGRVKTLEIISHLEVTWRLPQKPGDSRQNLETWQAWNGDMIAQDAMYHRPCLLDLYRKASTSQLEGHYSDKERQLHGIALSELVAFLETSYISVEDKIPVFRLYDLTKFYCERLEELGLKLEGRIHSTRLKNRILSQFDDLTAYNEGREVLLVFNSDVGEALTSAASINYNDEGFILAKAATIIRRDILGSKHSEFEGGFSPECQESYVPASIFLPTMRTILTLSKRCSLFHSI